MYSVAIFADLHLPESPDTVKEEVLDWALREAVNRRVDLIAGAGDLTACGSPRAVVRLRQKLNDTGIPWCSTPGNADLRNYEARPAVTASLTVPESSGRILLIDSARRRIAPEVMAAYRQLPPMRGRIAVTHCPGVSLPRQERDFLEELHRSGRIDLLVAGHLHEDCEEPETGTHLVRGLDPDKAVGGPPALTIFSFDGMLWHRENIACPLADPRRWSCAEKQEFLQDLGFSAMGQPLMMIEEAIQRQLPVLELRFGAASEVERLRLLNALTRWRQAGGRCLLMLLPELLWRSGRLTGVGRLRRAIQLARDLMCDQVVLPIPEVSVGEWLQPAVREELGAVTAELLLVLERDVTIGFLNRHMRFNQKDDAARPYGCTPEECAEWVELMRERLPEKRVGIMLDAGFARNNSPLSNRFTLSQWYHAVGSRCVGYHLHQILREGRQQPMRNYEPFLTIFGRLWSLSSFFMAWQRGILARAPMILEIRDGAGPSSYDRVRRELEGVENE